MQSVKPGCCEKCGDPLVGCYFRGRCEDCLYGRPKKPKQPEPKKDEVAEVPQARTCPCGEGYYCFRCNWVHGFPDPEGGVTL